MKFSTAAGALLLAGTAIAMPSPEGIKKMAERRHERIGKKLAARRAKGNFVLDRNSTGSGEVSDVTFDSNWAGAVMNDNGITQVAGTFNNPAVKAPGSGDEYGAAVWVGIDGDSCQSAILQTGVSGVVEDGEPQYAAWYEWYPDFSFTFDGFEVSPGDSITAKVVASSNVAGTATVTNHNTGKSVSHSFKNMGSVGTLCQQNAEWIVEDFETGDSLIPIAEFNTVGFTSASYVAGGSTKSMNNPEVLDIKQGSQRYTQTTVNSGSALTVQYVG